jgi:hypothetical protein
MNFWECILDACRKCNLGIPNSTSNITLYDLIRWGNTGHDIIANKTDCIEKLVTFSTVANQLEYTPDASFIRPIHADYFQSTSSLQHIQFMDIIKFRYYEGSYISSMGGPCIGAMFGNKIRLLPIVTTSAPTTTMSANISKNATSITGLASTASFHNAGRGIIGTDVFEYTAKTATTFTGVTWGLEGTTAAAHDGSVTPLTVTARDLNVWCNARYKVRPQYVYNTGTCGFVLNDATVTGTSTNFLANVFPGDFIGTSTNPSKWYQVLSVTDDTHLELTSNFGETTVSTTSYVATSGLDIPQENSELLTLYMLYNIKKKQEIEPIASQYQNEFEAKVQQLRIDTLYNNSTVYPSLIDDEFIDFY